MQKVLLGIVLLLLSVANSFAAQSSSLPEGTLTGAQISGLVYNTTAEVDFLKTEGKGLSYFSPNGELKLIKGGVLYKGHWKVRKKSGRLCTKLGGSSWRCRILVPAGKKFKQYVVKKNGKHRHELTYKKFHSGRQLKALHKAPFLPQGTLSAKQIEKLFSGKTVTSVTAKQGRKSLSYYAADGTVEQIRDGAIRSGKWRVNDKGRICLQMENLKEKCRIIVKEGDLYKKYIVKKNNHHQHSVSYTEFVDGRRL